MTENHNGRDPFNQKVVHLKRWTRFFETFPVGPNLSIEFWTEICGNFGWMDRAQYVKYYLTIYLSAWLSVSLSYLTSYLTTYRQSASLVV